MNNEIKKVLKKIINKGYVGYIVGGYIRDFLLGNESYDIDIATSAKPNELLELFPEASNHNYGGVSFKIGSYSFDITTFRKEISYENRRPLEFEYIDSMELDYVRRDFTINSLYMDIDGKIYDFCNGQEDIKNKKIKLIGNIKDRIVEDPLRILRAIRFKTLLSFDIDPELVTFIKQNKGLLSTLSYTRRKEELDYIINSNNRIEGLKYIKELGLEDVLEITIPEDIKDSCFPLTIWSELDAKKYPFTKNEINEINNIKKICEYGIIDNTILYKYGLYTCQLACDLLSIDRSYVSELYKNLRIYSSKDIDIRIDDILILLNIKPGRIIKDIIADLEIKILDNELKNDKKEIIKYIENNWR